jgi:hypothetical protein
MQPFKYSGLVFLNHLRRVKERPCLKDASKIVKNRPENDKQWMRKRRKTEWDTSKRVKIEAWKF